ncbi:hypothetical protein ABOM_011821 [Aspergillus bombycis]|uniref:Cytochrome P450 n=1 Tax=Aspergillus bombycis TaxID=109264 RepID=A0A1F7ZKB0_9EURO|nr:hypothetical protein ABOM_011821 [Aspergillus bombycis]OGM39872.1 hypothetical protein ABOM_011821 [Aspergillus bombycis]
MKAAVAVSPLLPPYPRQHSLVAMALIDGFQATAVLLIVVSLLFHLSKAYQRDNIKGIPRVQGWPVVGNLLQLQRAQSFSSKLQSWSKTYGPNLLVKLGQRPVVISNTFDGICDFWIKNQSSLISRPTLHTFHNVISSSEAFTIGTSPWDQSCKLRRKAAALTLNNSAVHRYVPAISREINDALHEILVDTHHSEQGIQPKLYLKKFVLNVSLTCSFGTRISTVRDALLKEIVDVEEALTRYRSHTNNLQDYLPFLRWIPSAKTGAKAYSERRDIYMNRLIDQLKSDIANGIDAPCSVGQIMKDPNYDFNNVELMSLSITLLSAGLDTIPANLTQGVAVLASKQGQEIQEDMRGEILARYSSFEEAWEKVVAEEAVPGLQSLVQEILRYFSVVPMGFPRTNITPVVLDNGISIPENTWFYMNSKSANFDPLVFPEPDKFIPRRFVDKEESEPQTRRAGGPPMRHFGYGAGTRACVGYHLANRLMYGILGRLILGWKIQAPGPVDIHHDTYNACPSSLVAEPKDFL